MGLLDLGTPKTEKRTQMFIRDDDKIIFRKLPIDATFLVEKNKDDVVTAGWRHIHSNQFAFPGYKGIKSDMVTISHGRDIIFDPFDIVEARQKPNMNAAVMIEDEDTKAVQIVPQFLVDLGNSQVQKQMAKPGKQSSYNKLISFLGWIAVMQGLIMGALALINRGG